MVLVIVLLPASEHNHPEKRGAAPQRYRPDTEHHRDTCPDTVTDNRHGEGRGTRFTFLSILPLYGNDEEARLTRVACRMRYAGWYEVWHDVCWWCNRVADGLCMYELLYADCCCSSLIWVVVLAYVERSNRSSVRRRPPSGLPTLSDVLIIIFLSHPATASRLLPPSSRFLRALCYPKSTTA
jgi:hypothetical protein